jgi:hypothetical protein
MLGWYIAAAMKHTAIYVRVSAKLQDTASQEPDLKRWAEAHDGECVWYRDKFTGRTMDPPGWNKLTGRYAWGRSRGSSAGGSTGWGGRRRG